MTIVTYDIGDPVTLAAAFTDEDGADADPTTVNLIVRAPDGDETTYNQASLDNPAVGAWSKTFVVDVAGTWSYRFTGSGAVAAVEEATFTVTASKLHARLPTLADPEELATYLGTDALDNDKALQVLELASGLIRLATGRQIISVVTDDEIELRGTWSDALWLPQWPVTAISSITVDGIAVASGDYTFTSDGRVTLDCDSWVINAGNRRGHWGGPGILVAVTYTHGYPIVPDDVKAVCLALAARIHSTPDGGAIATESLGAYSVTYARAAAAVLSNDEKKVLRPYSRRNHTVPTG